MKKHIFLLLILFFAAYNTCAGQTSRYKLVTTSSLVPPEGGKLEYSLAYTAAGDSGKIKLVTSEVKLLDYEISSPLVTSVTNMSGTFFIEVAMIHPDYSASGQVRLHINVVDDNEVLWITLSYLQEPYSEFFGGRIVAETMDEAERANALPLLAVVAEESVLDDDMEAGYLTRATRKSLELLSAEAERRDKGFVLMVEGSFIDWACHGNDAEELLFLMRDFDSTVAAAMDFADRTPGTLVVVTADHETGGLTIPSNEADFTRSESGLNYSFSTTGHTGTMVPVYLYGAGADRITGVMDNTQLSQRIMQLLGLE